MSCVTWYPVGWCRCGGSGCNEAPEDLLEVEIHHWHVKFRGVKTSMTRIVIGWVWYSGMRSTNNEKLVASWVWFTSMTLLQCRCNRRKYREACVVRRLHWHLVPWKGRKWRKAQIQNFVIRDMFLTPNVNAYERNILSTPMAMSTSGEYFVGRRSMLKSADMTKNSGLVRRLHRGDGW